MASKATGTVAGATTQVIYNNAGAYAGSANFIFDGTKIGMGKTPSAGTPQRLQIKQPDAVYSGIGIEKSDDDSYLGIGYWSTSAAWTLQPTYQSTGSYLPLAFATGGSERMRINAGAPILCLAGGNTSATGTGIAFPATQSASSDANTLDDYEEGTWTPAKGSGLVVVGTFSSSARYTKIGRLVYISGRLTGSTSIQTVAGSEMFKNLPFTVFEATAYGGFTNDNTTTTGGVAVFSTVAYSTITTGVGANNNFDFSVTYSV
jgi:hypothetical protein